MRQPWFKKGAGAWLIGLASLLTFLVPLLQGNTLGPWKQIRHLAPWNGPAPSRPWDVLQMDSVLQFYGWRNLVFQAWHHWQAPWWNPHILNGTPLLGNSQSGGFYPPHILIGLLGVPTGVGILLLAIFHLAWAGIGCYALIKALDGSELGATLGGAAFASSAFFIAWTPLSSVVETVAWIPWALLFAHKLISNPKEAPVHGLWLGVCLAMMVLAGHLQFAFYGFVAVALWVATGWIKPKASAEDPPLHRAPIRVVTGAMITLAVLAALTFFQLKPVLQMGHLSHRQTQPTADGYAAYIAGSDQWTELPSLATPSLLGTPNQSVGSEDQPLQAYWPAYTYRGADFAETAISWGPLIFFAIGFGFKRLKARKLIPILTIGGIGALLAFGTPLNWLFYNFIPGWAATGSPGRAGCLLVLAGCIVGGLALTDLDLSLDPASLKPALKTGFISLVAACLLGILVMNFQANSVWSPIFAKMAVIGAIGPKVLTGTTLSLLFAAALAALLIWKGEAKYKTGGVVALCFLQPLLLYPVLTFGQPSLPMPSTQAGRIAIVTGPWSLLTPPKALAPPNTAALSGIDEVGGYDSLIRKEAQARIESINQGGSSPPENGNMMEITSGFDPQKLADAGVTEVWSQNRLPQMPTTPIQSTFGYIYPLPGPGRASTPAGPAKVVAEDANSVTVQAIGPGPLTLRDDLPPDWFAEINGNKMAVEFSPWPTVNLAQTGPQTVRFVSGNGVKATQEGWVFLALLALIGLGGGYFSLKSVRIPKKVS